ncbi:MAG: rod shape-determining protein MreD [Egibacteraceae bacterium]
MIARVVMMTFVAAAALLVQTVVLPGFAVRGWRPDLVLLTVIGFALVEGPQAGLRYGFAAGFMLDLVSGTGQLVGLSSLILLSAGWVAGQARPYLANSPVGGQMAIGGLVSAAALLLRGLLAMLLDIGHYSPIVLLQGVLVTGLYNAVLAPVVCGPLANLAGRFTGGSRVS